MAEHKSDKGVLGVFGGAACIATAPIFAVLAQESTRLAPVVTAFWRLAVAAPILVLVALRWSPRPARVPAPQRRLLWLALPGACFAGDLWVWHTSMTMISAASATLLANLAAVIVPVVAWLLLGERLVPRFWVGTLVAVMGTALLLVMPEERIASTLPGAAQRYGLGNLLGLATAGFYAAYQLTARRARQLASTLTVMAWTSTVGAVLLGGIALWRGDAILPASWSGLLPLLGMALVGQVAGQGLILWSMRHVSASVLAVALLFQPVVSAFLGYWVLGQAMSRLQLLGVVLVVIGLGLVTRRVPTRVPARSA